MKSAIKRVPAAVVLIVMSLTGCDNVSWGGVEVEVVPPPAKASAPSSPAPKVREEKLPEGRVLYYAARSDSGATLVPVGEVSGDSLLPIRGVADPPAYAQRFIEQRLQPGTEFTLFRSGRRVGTLVVRTAAVTDSASCGPQPRAEGRIELSPEATRAEEFLALAETRVPPGSGSAAAATNRNMDLLAPILAEKLLRSRRARLPGNWQQAQAQLQPFPVTGQAEPAFTATFLVGDTLRPGLDDDGYSLFFVGVPGQQYGYDTVYVSFHDYPTAGRFAPRVVDYLDWNGDQQVDLLLQVFGRTDTWFEAVDRAAGGWRRSFDGRCAGQGEAAQPGGRAQ